MAANSIRKSNEFALPKKTSEDTCLRKVHDLNFPYSKLAIGIFGDRFEHCIVIEVRSSYKRTKHGANARAIFNALVWRTGPRMDFRMKPKAPLARSVWPQIGRVMDKTTDPMKFREMIFC